MICSAKAQAKVRQRQRAHGHPSRHRRCRPVGRHSRPDRQDVNAIIINPADRRRSTRSRRRRGRHRGHRRRRGGHRSRGLQPVERSAAVRVPRRLVAVQAARRPGRRRLHARHRRPSRRHDRDIGFKKALAENPGITSPRNQTKWDQATAVTQINDFISSGVEFDGIWTSGIDNVIVDALSRPPSMTSCRSSAQMAPAT